MKYRAILTDGSEHDLNIKDETTLVLKANSSYFLTKEGELIYKEHILRIKPIRESGDFKIEKRGETNNG